MPLSGKYLKYNESITFEIFKLVWDRLLELGWRENSNSSIESRWVEFTSKYPYFRHTTKKEFNTHEDSEGRIETTVQEILGYDPFVKEVVEEVIPEYVEYIKSDDVGKIAKVLKWSAASYCRVEFPNGTIKEPFKHLVKPSTKKAFDAQNQRKFINNKGFFVALQNKLTSHSGAKVTIGKIYKANSRNGFGDDRDGRIFFTNDEKNIKWFATLQEAEEFAKTLIEPVKEEIKQPLKQAVHCKAQKEWDFVLEKLNYEFYPPFNVGYHDTIDFIDRKESFKSYYKDYQILSFQEWCDLNGYKMEKEVKFEVGKWYKIRFNDFIKISEFITSRFFNEIHYSERIENGIHSCKEDYIANSDFEKYALKNPLNLEEIQQYLPDDHPDKIKPNREFEVGDYIFVMIKGKNFGDILKVTDSFIEKKSNYSGVWINHKPSSFGGGGFRLNGNGYIYGKDVRHATPEEINSHLISIGQIPAGEPLNTGIEPNKDGMFEYTTYNKTTHISKCSTVSGRLKMTLSIDDEELPMVNIIKTNSIKQLLNND